MAGMPIKVTCQCGQSFNAKDELAGKAVKCPKCQQPLRIPASSAAKPAAKSPAAAPKSPAAAASDPFGAGNLFDEVGLKQHAAGTMPCPGCGKPLAKDVIVCVECGYNMKLGRRMTTSRVGGGDEHAGHGAIASAMLERAAQTLEEDQAAEQASTKEGMPWWVYLILLLILVGFLGTMVVIANRPKPKDDKKGQLAPAGETRIARDVLLRPGENGRDSQFNRNLAGRSANT